MEKNKKMNILIPMAGEGSRFKIRGYKKPKPLIKIKGKTMIELSIETLDLEGQYIFLVRKYEKEEFNQELKKILKKVVENPIIITVDYLTEGATATCLIAKKHINNDNPLIITNCDQVMDWAGKKFVNSIKESDDGIVVTYDSTNPKNSFIKLKNGKGIEVAEKKPISDIALVGIHYWKKGKDFVKSAEHLMRHKIKEKNEYYIAPTYNPLIKEGKTIRNYHLEKGQYQSLGSPEDVKIYLGKQNEFNYIKPKTILCDLDGTIFKHPHRFSSIKEEGGSLTEGVREKFDEWDSAGHTIIIITGRKENAREITEKQLNEAGLPYDKLIMNVSNGARVLINDKLQKGASNRAIAVNIVTDGGFLDERWEEIGL